ncbi:MAG: apolipoprotein N-acyltransferase [Ignavibacteriales bacterium]|nr:apolipoprotein N-acyltransferase [Ignavibacteriales bacterium]
MTASVPHPGTMSSGRFNAFLAISSGLLLGLSFPPTPLYSLAHIGLLPLLFLLDRLSRYGEIARFSYLAMFVFHLITLYWVGGFTHMRDGYLVVSGASLLLAHPMFYWIPILSFVFVRKQLGETAALVSFPFLWVGFEYFHALGEFSFPWLTLGNSQAYDLNRIQIAEYASVFGISFFIVAFNTLGFVFIKKIAFNVWKFSSRPGIAVFSALLIVYGGPIVFGISASDSYNLHEERTMKVGIVQPNIDPYEKWGEGFHSKWDSYLRQMDILIDQTKRMSSESLDVIVWPETAIPFYILLPQNRQYLGQLRQELDSIGTPVFAGLPDGSYRDSTSASPTAQWIEGAGAFFEGFNSATLLLPAQDVDTVYHKVVLVPFAERIPHAERLTFLIEPLKWSVGISSWGKGDHQVVFELPLRSGEAASFGGMICYELVFPSYVRTFVEQGAEFLVIISNDSWWGHTSGAYQLAAYSVIRAVETRRWIVRCANGGISGVIDPAGRFYNKTEFLEATSVIGTIGARTERSFYVRHGDLVGKGCLTAFFVFMAAAFVRRLGTS